MLLLAAMLGAGLILTGCLLKPATPGSRPAPGESVPIPAGWFWMGADDGRLSNEPLHRVYLDDYAIHKTEVTRGQFAAFIEATAFETDWPTAGAGDDLDRPATGVLWKGADAYCRWVGMRLPTEAEWEKAARGEDGRRYPWGNEWDVEKANTAESGFGETLPVGSYDPQGASPYEVLDMAGNAAEWVADYFDFRYYQISPDHNPSGPAAVMDRGLRGGSYESTHPYTTTYIRDSSHSVRPNPRVGFRCASDN